MPDSPFDVLAAVSGLVEAARSEPGEWKMHVFGYDDEQRVVEMVLDAGCEVRCVPHWTNPGDLVAISIRAARPRQGVADE